MFFLFAASGLEGIVESILQMFDFRNEASLLFLSERFLMRER
jgi:hypothetical protein